MTRDSEPIDPLNLAGLVPPAIESAIIRAQSALMATMLAVYRGDLTLAEGLAFTGLTDTQWEVGEAALAGTASRAQRLDPTGGTGIAATLTIPPGAQ